MFLLDIYHGHRFPAVVISYAVRWYFRFSLSLRDTEELLLERGVVVTYETIRCWCDKFGADSPVAPKRRGASRAAHGIWTRCS
jgi:putative transposase